MAKGCEGPARAFVPNATAFPIVDGDPRIILANRGAGALKEFAPAVVAKCIGDDCGCSASPTNSSTLQNRRPGL